MGTKFDLSGTRGHCTMQRKQSGTCNSLIQTPLTPRETSKPSLLLSCSGLTACRASSWGARLRSYLLSPASAQPSHQLEWREAGSDFPSGEWSPELPSAGIAVSAHCHPLGQPQKSPNRFTYTGRSSSSPEYLQPMRDRVWGIRNPVSLPLRKKF